MPVTITSTGSPVENHSFTARNTHAEKISRTSSYEDKVEMQDITRKYKVVNHVDKKTWEWNTDLIEAMELEHVMSQDAQDVDDGETRHEFRETREHQFNEKRLVSSTTRPHEPRRCA